MKIAKTSGFDLAYESIGQGEPILLIHGATIADSFVPLLQQRSLTNQFQLTHIHRRGYGQSAPVEPPYSIEQQASDCRSLIEELEFDRVHLVGHSYGGVVALQLALASPETVQTLSLLEPALMIGSSGNEYERALLDGIARYREVGAAQLVDEFLEMRFGKGYQEPLEQRIPGVMKQATNDAGTVFDVELPALMEWEFDEFKAARIMAPVLCVLGQQSRVLSPRFVETYSTMLQWFSNSRGFELPGAAHGLQMQNPEPLADCLADFWGSHTNQ
jgi:pimeloyl-ACP methyl ester carboxylesterase